MKKILALAAIGIIFCSHAMAAAPKPFSWNGIYAGINGGLGTSSNTSAIGLVSGGIFPGSDVPSSIPLSSAGLIVGGQLGYNWVVMPQTVLGFETDLDYTSISSSDQEHGPTDTSRTIRSAQNLEFFGSARARAGYEVMPNLLGFFTGGLAYGVGRVNTDMGRSSGCSGNNCEAGSKEDAMLGWTVGAGAEYSLGDNVSIKAEYLHYDLGSIDFQMNDVNFPGNVLSSHTNFDGDIVRVGVNYSYGSL